MSLFHKEMVGTGFDNKKTEAETGKEVKPNAGNFKTGAILPKLPATQHIEGGFPSAKGFKDFRDSEIREGSI